MIHSIAWQADEAIIVSGGHLHIREGAPWTPELARQVDTYVKALIKRPAALARPSIPELWGMYECQQALGITRSTINYHRKIDFPKPALAVRATALWLPSDAVAWATERRHEIRVVPVPATTARPWPVKR